MDSKIEVFSLPVTSAFRRMKRYEEERGEIALVEDGYVFRHLAVFSIRKGSGFFRGGHYHKKKTERFYVISGKVRVLTVDLKDGSTAHVDVRQGDKLIIHPWLAHRFHALEEAWLVEYYDSLYDPEDDYPFHQFPDEPI